MLVNLKAGILCIVVYNKCMRMCVHKKWKNLNFLRIPCDEFIIEIRSPSSVYYYTV